MKNTDRGGYDQDSEISALGWGNSRRKGLKEVRENLDRRLRSRWLAEAKVLAGEGDALGHGGQFLGVLFHEFDPVEEAGGKGVRVFHGFTSDLTACRYLAGKPDGGRRKSSGSLDENANVGLSPYCNGKPGLL
jgi:hypothetical protein